jgi:hypothetical protein
MVVVGCTGRDNVNPTRFSKMKQLRDEPRVHLLHIAEKRRVGTDHHLHEDHFELRADHLWGCLCVDGQQTVWNSDSQLLSREGLMGK